MQQVKIIGVGSYLPGPEIDNKTLAHMLGANQEWIDFFIGTKTRHFCLDLPSGELQYQLSDLCSEAAKKAIHQANIKGKEIDAIVLGTATPDNLMPATVNIVADKLGLNNIATYQLQSGCAGAVQALDVGTQLIKSGRANHVLVIGADTCHKFLRNKQDISTLSSHEMVNYVLFGDGAGAVVLSNKNQPGIVIADIINQLTGLDQTPGQVVPWFGAKALTGSGDMDGQGPLEDYKAIEQKVPEMANHLLDELLTRMRWSKAEVDLYLPPQLSKNMTDKIIKHLNLSPSKTLNCVETTGNTGNAMPFMQLEMLTAIMKKNQKIIMLTIESSKWLKAGVALYVE